jgi:hypothetical protein
MTTTIASSTNVDVQLSLLCMCGRTAPVNQKAVYASQMLAKFSLHVRTCVNQCQEATYASQMLPRALIFTHSDPRPFIYRRGPHVLSSFRNHLRRLAADGKPVYHCCDGNQVASGSHHKVRFRCGCCLEWAKLHRSGLRNSNSERPLYVTLRA